MPQECVLTLDNVTVVERSYLTGRITSVSDDVMSQVCDALGLATGCD